jgi:hypothetical protein
MERRHYRPENTMTAQDFYLKMTRHNDLVARMMRRKLTDAEVAELEGIEAEFAAIDMEAAS